MDREFRPAAYCYDDAFSKFTRNDSDYKKLQSIIKEERSNQGFLNRLIFGKSLVTKMAEEKINNLKKDCHTLFADYQPKYVANDFGKYEEKLVSKITKKTDLKYNYNNLYENQKVGNIEENPEKNIKGYYTNLVEERREKIHKYHQK
ncbi:MAG: hypothetical protein FJ368_04005 [Pelagibacterales bacterium]|nr:hypothetical protein [Pelagibacterales bacterium]